MYIDTHIKKCDNMGHWKKFCRKTACEKNNMYVRQINFGEIRIHTHMLLIYNIFLMMIIIQVQLVVTLTIILLKYQI